MVEKLVSIIIPTYKGTESLCRALNSVFKQTYQNIEIIVVDDNDPESIERRDTEYIICEFCKKHDNLIYVKHERNKNGAAARNSGFRASKGEYITFLDDDDFILKDRVSEAVNCLSEHQDADICFFDVFRVNKITGEISVHSNMLQDNYVRQILVTPGLMGTGSNIFLRRKVFEDVGGFNERFVRYQDVEFMGRCFARYNAVWINIPTVVRAYNSTNNRPDVYKLYEMQELLLETARTEMFVSDKNTIETLKVNMAFNLFRLAVLSNVNQEDMAFVVKNLKKYKKLNISDVLRLACYKIKIRGTNLFVLLNAQKSRYRKEKNMYTQKDAEIQELMRKEDVVI